MHALRISISILPFMLLAACGGNQDVEITTQSLPDAIVGQAYSTNIFAEGGRDDLQWDLASTAPPGLQFGSHGYHASLRGTPAVAGVYTLDVSASDHHGNSARRVFTLRVNSGANPLAITTASLPDGNETAPYSQIVTASGGSGGYSWQVVAGTLPPGLALQPVGTPSTTLAGTPSTAGNFAFTLEVIDSASGSDQQSFAIGISAALVVTTSTLPGGQIGAAYSSAVNASGGSGTGYQWSVIAGALPPGLSVPAAGTPATTISGTPTTAGTFNFTLRVTDSLAATGDAALSIAIASNLSFQPAALANPVFGAPYSQSLTGSGGVAPYTWSVAMGGLPPGLSLASSGTPATSITGTPTSLGTWNFTIRLTDSGSSFFERGYSATVDPGGALSITTLVLPEAVVGLPYSTLISASGGSASGYTWALVAGSLDPSFLLNASGTPQTAITGLAASVLATCSFTLQVMDSALNTATRAFTLTVRDPLIITTASLPDGDTTQVYSQAIMASGGTTVGYSWTIAAGTLPPGLVLGASGTPSTTLSGTPTLAGTFNFTLSVTDSGSYGALRAFSLLVIGPGLVTTVAGSAATSLPPDGTLAAQAGLGSPRKVVIRPNGDMYVVQSGWNIVSRVDASDGRIYRVAGNTFSGSTGDNGPATLAQLNAPMSVAFDAAGDMFIADSGNHSIRRVNAGNNFITTFMGGFTGPYDLVFDSSGRLVVCDGDRIKRIDLLTLSVTTIAGGGSGYSGDGGPATAAGIGSANAIVFDAAGNFYFTDQFYHTARRVSAAGIITTVAGTGSLGTSVDGIPAVSASLRWPSGVALAANGDLLLCDTNSHRIRRVDMSTGLISTFAGNPTFAGMAGIFGGDGALAVNADFHSPQGIIIGTDGHVYVCDNGNNRVRRIRQ